MRNRKSSILPETIIKQRKEKALERREIISLILKVICIILAVFVIFKGIYGIDFVKGQNMYPAIKDGDIVLYYRLNRKYQNGEIVSFKENNEDYLCRIVAREGDTVDITDSGDLIVNGNTQQEEIYFDTYIDTSSDIKFPYQVEEGNVFVLGDYRTGAVDSRHFGAIPLQSIRGKVISIIRRRGF